jgi:hypothetical protein
MDMKPNRNLPGRNCLSDYLLASAISELGLLLLVYITNMNSSQHHALETMGSLTDLTFSRECNHFLVP